MRKKAKKSTYRHVVIKNKKYFFYKITWVDIVGDSGHADDRNVFPKGCIKKMEKVLL
jgi:hypothetical protein